MGTRRLIITALWGKRSSLRSSALKLLPTTGRRTKGTHPVKLILLQPTISPKEEEVPWPRREVSKRRCWLGPVTEGLG